MKYLGADGTYKTNSVGLGDRIDSSFGNLITLLYKAINLEFTYGKYSEVNFGLLKN